MNDHSVADDFDVTLRRSLDQLCAATDPEPGLADRLITYARAAGPDVVSLTTHRRRQRWVMPMLAAAAIVALAVGGAVGSNLLSQHDRRPAPQHSATFVPAPPSVPHFRAYFRVSFTDTQHGWALGEAQCGTGRRTDCATLLATADSGRSWRRIGLPTGLTSPFDSASCGNNGTIVGPCVDQVAFANESVGYLWSLHDLYWTTDGGKTWSLVAKPGRPWPGAASVVVAGDSAVAVAPLAECSVPCAGALETAPLGSGRWHTIATPADASIAYNASTLAVHDRDVYVFAGQTFEKPSSGVLRSSDGGRTWHRLTGAPCEFARPSLVADDGALVATCEGATANVLRVAEPGAKTFTTAPALPGDGSAYVVAARSGSIMTAVQRGDTASTFYRTADGGGTWNTISTLPVTGDATFISGSVGSVLSTNGTSLYVTQDGGATWRRTLFAGR